ncbi:MAG: peptidyl-prolyl cis-trans isomerase [Candidatus Korobacteraceae bacterium]
MLRSTLLALAMSCAVTCAGYAQQPASQPTPPPAAGASGQNPPAAEPAANPAPAASNVPMNEPVLTLKGACEPKAGSTPPQGCVSSLTREQFEQLTTALQPGDRGPVPPEIKRKFATQYAKLLILADVARQLGLENDPKVQQIFTFAKNQILSESLNQHFMEEYAHPTDQQIQDYYNQNQKKYTEVTLQRIIVPKVQATADKPKPDEAAEKVFVDKIRERWVAGEDPAKLEKESMEHSGNTSSAPDVNVGARRPGSLPEAHEAVFEMKVNEISTPFSDPAAYYIYKVITVRQVPLSEVKTTITSTLQRQQYNEKMQQIQSAVTPVLNDAYFGPEPPANIPTNMIHPGMPPGRMPPGAGAPPPPGPGTPPAPGNGAPPK